MEIAEDFRHEKITDGEEVAEIYLYEDDDGSGGACPDGDPGAYWPVYEPVN